MQNIPAHIDFAQGSMYVSREASIHVDGGWINVFQRNTIAVRVTHPYVDHDWIVVFPDGWLSLDRSREDIIATAMFGAGVARGSHKRVVRVEAVR